MISFSLLSFDLLIDMFPELLPKHYLDDFDISARVDWLDLEVLFHKKTQFRYVQRAFQDFTSLGKLHVRSLGGGNMTTDRFIIRFHDPLLKPLIIALKKVSDNFSKMLEIKVAALELTLDFKPKFYDNFLKEKLAAALFSLTRNLAYRHSKHRDIITFPGKYYEIKSRQEAIDGLKQGLTLHTGRKGQAIRHRAYIKSFDSVKSGHGIRIEECARLEVTLNGTAITFKKLKNLASLKFESLLDHFRQVKLIHPPYSATEKEKHEYNRISSGHEPLGVLISEAEKARESHKRVLREGTARDSHANSLISTALRTLTRRFGNSVKEDGPTPTRIPIESVELTLPSRVKV